MRKNIILNLAEQIKLYLIEVMEEENGCNEGSLSMHYEEIMELLIQIKTETLLIQNFWEEI